MNLKQVDVMEYQPFSSWPASAPGLSEAGFVNLRNLFVQNVAHELRTPLTILLGYTELLQDGYGGVLSSEQQQMITTMLKQVNQLRQLTERVGLLLGAEAGLAVHLSVAPAELVEAAVAVVRPTAEQAGLEVVVNLEAGLRPVSGDARHLQEALVCLLENGIKFTPAGGRITVNLYREPGWICITTVDTGVGMAEPELDRLFAGFYQADGSTTRRHSGIGLGLTLVGAVAKAHGGRIEVSSQPGQGSRFTFKLPER
jgi:signal transduction histidine kinase